MTFPHASLVESLVLHGTTTAAYQRWFSMGFAKGKKMESEPTMALKGNREADNANILHDYWDREMEMVE